MRSTYYETGRVTYRVRYLLMKQISKILPILKYRGVIEIDGKQAIIMEYINGRTIGNILFENMERAEYFMGISIDIQQRIYMVIANSLEPMSEKLRRQIELTPHLNKRHKSTFSILTCLYCL